MFIFPVVLLFACFKFILFLDDDCVNYACWLSWFYRHVLFQMFSGKDYCVILGKYCLVFCRFGHDNVHLCAEWYLILITEFRSPLFLLDDIPVFYGLHTCIINTKNRSLSVCGCGHVLHWQLSIFLLPNLNLTVAMVIGTVHSIK